MSPEDPRSPGASGVPPERRCSNCGALPGTHEARYCEYCGKPLPLPIATPPAAAPSPSADVAERFRRLQADPELSALLAMRPAVPSRKGVIIGSLFFLVFFLGVGLFVTAGFFFFFPPLALLPLSILGFGAFVVLRHVARTASLSQSPLDSTPALIVDERTRLGGGQGNSGAQTRYFATLEFPDGHRMEAEVPDQLAGQITTGDMGIAYLQQDSLVAFERRRV